MLIALHRNRMRTARSVARLHVADLQIDALDPRIIQGTHELRLSPGEHLVLYILAAKQGTVVGHHVMAAALGRGPQIRTNNVARHVTTLRRKLGDSARRPKYIETVIGVGYRFVGK
jgi:DNA-binding response OmpR family regulator